MKTHELVRGVISAFLAAIPLTTATIASADLDFESRVNAQRAIERVYYSHQLGASIPFEQAVPRQLLEEKVRQALQQSAALERYWGDQLTGDDLQKEMDRIAASTQFPDRLREIYEALSNDPVMVQECFVRPVLVDRMVRSRFAADPRIHAASRKQAESLRERLAGGSIDPLEESRWRHEVDVRIGKESAEDPPDTTTHRFVDPDQFALLRARAPIRVGPAGPIEERPASFTITVLLEDEPTRMKLAEFHVPKTGWEEWWSSERDRFDAESTRVIADNGATLAMPTGTVAASTFPCALDDTWDNGSLDALPDPSGNHSTIWTGSVMVVWGGSVLARGVGTGSRYDPTTDSWMATSRFNAPSSRRGHTAVWTGQRMIVWGGRLGSTNFADGGSYDPVNDIWTSLSTTNAPVARYSHSAVWTGTRMIVWGGTDGAYLESGGAYDPSADSWSPISTTNAPVGRQNHTAIWTGDTMVIWGGLNGVLLQSGGRYSPASNTWMPVSLASAPQARDGHTAVWTGNRMIVWGGFDGQFTYFATGGRYDPISDTWSSTSMSNAPSGRYQHTAIWTGSRMVVWGGVNDISFFNTGSRYDPASDSWSATTLVGAALGRFAHSAVWSGSVMVVWGGEIINGTSPNLPARYDPVLDAWLPNSTNYPPEARNGHRGVWTGNLMLIWGGYSDHILEGGRYDPLTDSWSPISRLNQPPGRIYFTSLWTGRHMIVWGGYSGAPGPATWYNSGGRYDPVADMWLPMTTNGAPAGRQDHSAVWTGSRMLVWGGSFSPPTTHLNSGGAYDPNTDTWASISMTGVPPPRRHPSSVWTGTEMIVWGGHNAGIYLNDGARYNPTLDSWLPISAVMAPAPRSAHAVWTGREMIVWGGSNGAALNTGGRYDPSLDRWLVTSTTGAPTARMNHSFNWTGSLILVWGGNSGTAYPTGGGRYDPVLDSWTPVTTTNGPRRRANHSTVWTGQHMIVWGGDSGGLTLYSGGRYIAAPSMDHDMDGVMVCSGDCDDGDAATYPGAAQVCDGRNNDCSAPGWPSAAGTNEVDDDGDLLSECQGDCDDTQATAWSTPGEVTELMLSTDGATLSWSPPANAGATSLTYDTLRSTVVADFATSALCVESNDGSDTIAVDATTPPAGAVLYYLSRAENGCPGTAGIGSLGSNSGGEPRPGRACP